MKSQTVEGMKKDAFAVKDVLQKKVHASQVALQEKQKRAETLIAENPKTAVAIAAGVGVAVGAAAVYAMTRGKAKKEAESEG